MFCTNVLSHAQTEVEKEIEEISCSPKARTTIVYGVTAVNRPRTGRRVLLKVVNVPERSNEVAKIAIQLRTMELDSNRSPLSTKNRAALITMSWFTNGKKLLSLSV